MEERTLNAKTAKNIFDYVLIAVLVVNLIYSLFVPHIKSEIVQVVFSYFCTPICIVLGVYAYAEKSKENVLSVAKFTKPRLNVVIATLLITFGMMFGLAELNNLFVKFLGLFGYNPTPITLPEGDPLNIRLVIIFICFLPALFEEYLMRGIIVKSLEKSGKIFAVLASATLFALFHMSPQQTIYQFAVGALYALIVVYGGNFYLTFISHFINNLFIVLNEYFFKITFTLELEIILTVLGLLALVLGLFLLVFNSKKEPKTAEMLSERKSFFKGFPFGVVVCVVFWIINLIG